MIRKEKEGFFVSYSKRHPITKKPYTLKRKNIPTKSKANQVKNELVILIDKKFKESQIPKWKNLVKEYIKSLNHNDLSKKTIDNYNLSLKAHTFDIFGERLIDSITPNEIKQLIKNKVGHHSPSHQKNILKYIRLAFQFAVDEGYLNSNPTPNMKFKTGDKIKKALTEEQAKLLLNHAKMYNSEWYPIWATALYTGLRNGELYSLTWDKIDLDRRQILVDSSWNSKDGFKDTKSGDDRIIEIAPNLLIILKEIKLQSSDSNFVLPRIDKWDKGEQARELRMFLEGLGLPRIRFHDLRATWATIMLSKGIPPIQVMMMGGWKDIKTLQVYIRKAGVNIKGITDNLDLHNPYNGQSQVLKF